MPSFTLAPVYLANSCYKKSRYAQTMRGEASTSVVHAKRQGITATIASFSAYDSHGELKKATLIKGGTINLTV